MTETKPFSLSVKMIVQDDRGNCLLLKRSMASKGNPGKWDFPGGKMDTGETFDQALLREVREETGLEATITGVAGTAYSESPTHRVIYLIMEGRAQPGDVLLSDEHEQYAWVEAAQLHEMDVVRQFKATVDEYSRKAANR